MYYFLYFNHFFFLELPDIDEMKFQKRFSLRSDPKFGLEVLEFDDDAIIRDCGISDRDIYLCWNGKTISNIPWDGATKSFEIPVTLSFFLSFSFFFFFEKNKYLIK